MSQETSAAAAASKPTSTGDELRLIFVGKTGAGKSSTASNISGKKDVFKASGLGKSMTVTCQCEKVEVLGYKLLLTDTPGMFDTSRTSKEIEGEIGEFVKMTAPGPHAILFVTSAANRFTDEEVGVIKKLEEMFGKAIEEYLIIVVTRTEDWEGEGIDVFKFLDDLPDEAKQVLETCIASKRAIAFQNRFEKDGQPRDKSQVKELLDMIVDTVKKNGNKCYTEEHWKKAEEEMKRREQEILDKEMKEEQERIEKIERDHRAKMAKEYETKIIEMLEKREKEREEREARERETREKREQELTLKLEQMRLDAEQKMESMKAEERARAKEELRRAEERMEQQRRREQEITNQMTRLAEEAAKRQDELSRTIITRDQLEADRRCRAQVDMERQQLYEEARSRARKAEEDLMRHHEQAQGGICILS